MPIYEVEMLRIVNYRQKIIVQTDGNYDRAMKVASDFLKEHMNEKDYEGEYDSVSCMGIGAEEVEDMFPNGPIDVCDVREEESFITKCAMGREDVLCVTKYLNEWHKYYKGKIPLCDFIGMTKEECRQWENDPLYLETIINSRRSCG